MKKEKRIETPEGCEIDKMEIIDGCAVITYKKNERKLPKTWEAFCKMNPVAKQEYYVNTSSELIQAEELKRLSARDRNLLPNRETAEAILALCQLIQLRDYYNGGWRPDWTDDKEPKYYIYLDNENEDGDGEIRAFSSFVYLRPLEILHFKSELLCEEFLRNFGELINKIMPLYGVKEGGEQ